MFDYKSLPIWYEDDSKKDFVYLNDFPDGEEIDKHLIDLADKLSNEYDSQYLDNEITFEYVGFKTMEDQNDNFYKMNIEAKTRHSGLEEINSSRLNNHMINTGAKFCLVVAPRFAKGVSNDIHGQKIITIRADDFAAYCQKDYQKNNYKYADFMPIYEIITNHYGEDITSLVRSLSLQRFGIPSL